MSTASRALEIYRKKNLLGLLRSIRLFIHYRVPNNRTALQLYYLFRTTILRRVDNGWCLHNLRTSEKFYFPQLESHVLHCRNHHDFLTETYFYSDYISIEESDVVFDVGAYVGLTTQIAAEDASQVYAVEPSPRALPSLRKNIEKYDNIEIIERAVSDKEGEMELQFGNDITDDSLIDPDDGGSGDTATVSVTTVSNLIDELDLDKVDFLKVEAEGVEPEVIRGAVDANIKKIACAGNDERFGETTYEDVATILREAGYSVNENSDELPYKMVYATQNESGY